MAILHALAVALKLFASAELLNILEDNDDVQAVSSNFDVSDDVLTSLTT